MRCLGGTSGTEVATEERWSAAGAGKDSGITAAWKWDGKAGERVQMEPEGAEWEGVLKPTSKSPCKAQFHTGQTEKARAEK